MKDKYAIIRVAKIKSFGQLKEYMLHVNREKETLNADKEREYQNFVLKGDSNVLKTVDEFIKEKGIKITQGKNKSVLCTEMLLTASPEFFKDANGNLDMNKTEKWIMENNKWLKETYKENYLFGKVHLDEKSPHISVIICATKYNNAYKREVLAHKAWFGKKVDKKKDIYINKLEDLQTDYAARMQAVGFKELNRGKHKSKARHQDIEKFYTDVNETKEKFMEAVEENKTIIKQLNLENEKKLAQAKIEINARNEIINQVAETYGIKEQVKQAYPKAKEIAERKVKGLSNDKDNSKGPEL